MRCSLPSLREVTAYGCCNKQRASVDCPSLSFPQLAKEGSQAGTLDEVLTHIYQLAAERAYGAFLFW